MDVGLTKSGKIIFEERLWTGIRKLNSDASQ